MKKVYLMQQPTATVTFVKTPEEADEIWMVTSAGSLVKRRCGETVKPAPPHLKVRVSSGLRSYCIGAKNREKEGKT